MLKTSVVLFISIMASVSCCGQQQSKTRDKGVTINGVRWATRNVGAPGEFADRPEDSGMFYQWNRIKAWPATDEHPREWEFHGSEGSEWEKANDPSPAGWRVPTYEEMMSLVDTEKVSSKWTSLNGIEGFRFTDKATGNTIFLPAAGSLGDYGEHEEAHSRGRYGYYWSSTDNENARSSSGVAAGICLYFFKGHSNDVRMLSASYGLCLRSVEEQTGDR